jgi:hypothetical protein
MLSGLFELASLTSWPLAASFRANVAPMFPAPMTPIFIGWPFVNWKGAHFFAQRQNVMS